MFYRLKKRQDFLRVSRFSCSAALPGVIVLVAPHPEGQEDVSCMREGFTASRKIGKAVARNRAKRRLRAASRGILPYHGYKGYDYVFIARAQTLTRSFQDLQQDFKQGLERVHKKLGILKNPPDVA